MKVDKRELLRRISKKSGYYMKDIEGVLDAISDGVADIIKDATAEERIEVKVFDGLIMGAKMVEAYDTKNPKDGSPVHVDAHLVPYTRIGRSFKEKVR